MNDNNIDAYFIVESWLKNEDIAVIGELEGDDCRLISIPRNDRTGGGLCCLYKSDIDVRNVESSCISNLQTMEAMETTIVMKGKKLTVDTIYRPGSTAKNRYPMSKFFMELNGILAHYNTYKNEVIFIGDFNIHVNNTLDQNAKKMHALLDLFDLQQLISQPTHRNGNTLDLVIGPKNSQTAECKVDDMNSDHNNILIHLKGRKTRTKIKYICSRKLKNIDLDMFKKDINSCLSHTKKVQSDMVELQSLLRKYSATASVLDKHAPMNERRIIDRNPTPWSKADIIHEKTRKRKLEKKWRRSRKQSDYENYKEQRNKYNNLLNELKRKNLSTLIAQNRGNSRNMFRVLNHALHRKPKPVLPPCKNDTELANNFIEFFEQKIDKIRTKLDKDNEPIPQDRISFKGKSLSSFRQMTEMEVKKILNKMSKSCSLDPLPLWMVKECIDNFLPTITRIINLSLQLSVVPRELKHAIIRPLLKKSGMELTLNNYRPVSNLPYLGKALEEAVIMQFDHHLCKNNINDDRQSAYKKNHSTETLLMKVHNDIMTSMDKGEVAFLVLLDLSAAFDTIDHKILLNRLKNMYGVEGRALRWFESYLHHRTQSVIVNDKKSNSKELKYGVPQGSKLGPVLFNAYIAPLSDVAKRNGVTDQKYADDEQLILSFKPSSQATDAQAVTKMEKCIKDIRNFLHENKLSNNSGKTEFIIIGGKQNLKKLDTQSITVDSTTIKAVNKVRNLGVVFDKNMSMDAQVSNMCRKAYLNIRNIAHIRKSLNKTDTKTAVHALVTPHLDYGNALLGGISMKNINRLQVAQNSAARLIERLGKHERISHIRKDLHWLPIHARIKFKILNMTWKSLNNQSPKYLSEMLRINNHERSTRSTNQNLLHIPRSQTKFGERAFSRLAPKLWNELPKLVRTANDNDTFRRRLKTHLFHNIYLDP
jgi:hypothetical protein